MGESFVVVWLGEWGSLKTGGDGFSFATPLRYAGCLWGWLANGVRNGVAHPTADFQAALMVAKRGVMQGVFGDEPSPFH